MPVTLITPVELNQAIAEQLALTVIDCRSQTVFAEHHIPGAVRVDWEAWCEKPKRRIKEILTSPGYWGKLADPFQANFVERLEELGVRSDSRIVVYADAKASKGREGRVAWMMAYLGAPNVSLLNGGFPAWLEAGLPVEKGNASARSGSFTLDLQPQRRCTTKELVKRLSSEERPLLIDTRSPSEFDGHLFWYQPRTGRIPGSRLLPFDAVFQTDGKHFVSSAEYAKLLPESYDGRKSVATYCEVGVRAATVALLHEIYTGQITQVYDGSMMEWSVDTRHPVERGSKHPQ